MGGNGVDGITAELAELGFTPVQRDRHGAVQYTRTPNRFLTEWVHDDGVELLFTWEFALGDWAGTMDWQIGAAETSFQILYPRFDVRLARDAGAVRGEVERLERRLAAIDLADPSL